MSYTQALADVIAEQKAGYIISYETGSDKERGRFIMVQTDQGWNPEPWFQEIYPECYAGANDGEDYWL